MVALYCRRCRADSRNRCTKRSRPTRRKGPSSCSDWSPSRRPGSKTHDLGGERGCPLDCWNLPYTTPTNAGRRATVWGPAARVLRSGATKLPEESFQHYRGDGACSSLRDYGSLSIQPMDLVNAAERCNDVEVFLVRMREKGLLTSIASVCFKSADRIPGNAGEDRQALLGPFLWSQLHAFHTRCPPNFRVGNACNHVRIRKAT
jgi:hypothetical protein